jgi:uncharacterized membrane-anchored protein
MFLAALAIVALCYFYTGISRVLFWAAFILIRSAGHISLKIEQAGQTLIE